MPTSPIDFKKLAGVDLAKLPNVTDVTPETITGYVNAMDANCKDERMKFIFEKLVTHLHDFVRETSITTEEWMTTIQFLTDTGKMCTDIRQEYILLSDILGVSSLIDTMNNAKPSGATEATVLGPFFTEDAHDVSESGSIASEGKGDYMYVEGRVLDTEGKPIAGAIINTWETDGFGLYDTQYENREGPECRGRLFSAEDGSYAFRAVVPIAYGVPQDGTVGNLLSKLGRHIYRPAHLHMMIEAPGFEKLVTALYLKGDPFLNTDAVFGVRKSLIVDLEIITDTAISKARGFKEEKPHAYLKKDFILATPGEAAEARRVKMHALAV